MYQQPMEQMDTNELWMPSKLLALQIGESRADLPVCNGSDDTQLDSTVASGSNTYYI